MLYNSNEVVSLEDFVKHYYKLFNWVMTYASILYRRVRYCIRYYIY
jgi:hypothetical protein